MKWIFSTVIAFVFAACSGPKVINTEHNNNVDWNTYRTFDFYKMEASGDTILPTYKQNIEFLQNAITQEMLGKGFRRATVNPDLLINIGLAVKEEVQTRQTDYLLDAPKYMGQRRYSWKSEEVEVGRYKEGTIVVHVVDSRSNTMIWKGAVEGILPKTMTKRQMFVRDGIHKLFEQVPLTPAP